MNQETTFTLLELNALVRQAIETALPREYWVEAELSECRESRGHCYMELVQKDELGNTPVARAQAKCWRQTWQMVSPYFERATGQPLHAGLKVRLQVYPQFHEAYGFSWIVTDIDPNFTMGDMARRRREIVSQLKAEGVFDMQKELRLPLFCQRIAVISSPTAAGYGDFCQQLGNNRYGFQFSTQLFPAIMQGELVEQSIIAALNDINYQLSIVNCQFDCVVIIRGGGGTADFSGFDTLALAENVAQFPLPIITGIGHDRDESILDMVSHARVKTPTDAADLLIAHLGRVMDAVDDAQQRIIRTVTGKMEVERMRMARLSERIPALFSVVRTRQESRISLLQERLTASLHRRLDTARHRLDLLGERIHLLDPALLLRRGYSITLKDGKAVRDANQLSTGDVIETRLEKGTVKSEII